MEVAELCSLRAEFFPVSLLLRTPASKTLNNYKASEINFYSRFNFGLFILTFSLEYEIHDSKELKIIKGSVNSSF